MVLFGLRGANDNNDKVGNNNDVNDDDNVKDRDGRGVLKMLQSVNNHMQIKAMPCKGYYKRLPPAFDNNDQVCIPMKMRIDCRIFGSSG